MIGFNAASGICSLQHFKEVQCEQPIEVSMPQAAYVRCNEDQEIIMENLAQVSMPQAAYVRCNGFIMIYTNKELKVSMPQAAYVRCNSVNDAAAITSLGFNAASGICSLQRTHLNPSWILNKNRAFVVKPVFTPFFDITEHVHRF